MKRFLTLSALALMFNLTACSDSTPVDTSTNSTDQPAPTSTPHPAPSFTLSVAQAKENFTTIEWAFQESKFCTANGADSTELFAQWMKQHDEAYRAAVKAVEDDAIARGLKIKFDQAAAVLSMIKDTQRDVAEKAAFKVGNCKDFSSSLETLGKQLHAQ